jgi:glutamine amidotransferase
VGLWASMCRLMAYMGPPVLVADVVLWPDRSIIKQSYDARERQMDSKLPSHLAYGNLNGDGFGIGWFSPDDGQRPDSTPCVFTSITPAWWVAALGQSPTPSKDCGPR